MSLNKAIMNYQMKKFLITKFQNKIILKLNEINFINNSDDSNNEEHENKQKN